MVEDLSELNEPVWLLTWDQLQRYGPLPVRLALREMPRRTGGDVVEWGGHQEAAGREA